MERNLIYPLGNDKLKDLLKNKVTERSIFDIDSRRIFIINNKIKHFSKCKHNVLLLPKYYGDENDKDLKIIIPFLKGKLFK